MNSSNVCVLIIGTTNLLSIERGDVRIQQCPQLCFTDTVNWTALGAKDYITNKTERSLVSCESCPSQCKDSCWNSTHCLKTNSDCHKECLGCTKRNSLKHCILCKNVKNDGECVSECPNDKYELQLFRECVTKEECEHFTEVFNENSIYFTHNNGKERHCIDECPTFYLLDLTTIGDKVSRTCKYCGSDCVKECSSEAVETEDAIKKLNGCTHIIGPLIIRNLKTTDANKLLIEHLAAIKYIGGILQISRTKLTSLDFLRNVTYIGLNEKDTANSTYSIVIYENAYLQKLWDFNKTLHIEGKYSFHDNPLLCLSEIKNLGKTTNVSYSPPIDVSENSNGEQATCVTVNIAESVQVIATSTNATITWIPPKLSENESYISFTVFYKEDKDRTATFSNTTNCEVSDWNKVFVKKGFVSIENLIPFSTYAYYIKHYISRGNYRQGTQSNIMYFATLSDDPDGFGYLKLTPIDYQTINLNWTRPKLPNGILDIYKLSYNELEEDFLFERDYCKFPKRKDGDHIDFDDDEDYYDPFHEEAFNKTTLSKTASNCNCSKPKPDANDELELFTKGAKSQLCNDLAKSSKEKQQCINFKYQMEKREKRSFYYIKINANETEYNVTNLKPFTMYVFYLAACNKPKEEHHCSGVLQRFARTKNKPNADNIEGLKLIRQDGNSVNISWSPPTSPNTPIVAYRINISSENSASLSCISILGKKDERIFKFVKDLFPGKYIITVQAESLAGISYGISDDFEVAYPSSGHIPLIAVAAAIFVFLTVVVTVYVIFKKKKMDGIRLVNPYYDGVYIQDQWEVDVNDIELIKELGRGNFGIVYQGLIKSKNLPCAVKVVNESLQDHQRIEFLIEATMMKSFNDCYHVVKLLGVVSIQQSPIVIMELMERGDLKSYLRRMRDSSHNLTSSEIYRLAVEIADGMAYLSAKKFVHRDLAARNCMVNANRTVKVGDFGMARDIYTSDYYRKESKGLLPIRWMAPESLADGVFTTDSDVWSYGTVLWEIATLAEQPYQGLSNEHVRQFIISKGRLTRPPECSDLLYDVMKQCWSWRPSDRPSFWDIVERLEDRVSEDFKLVAFVYSREASLFSRQRADNHAALSIAQRDDLLCHYNVSEEDINLHVGGVPRRPSYLQASISHRRFSPPDDIY